MKHVVALSASSGPVVVKVLGYDVPVLAAGVSVVVVILASLLDKSAPTRSLSNVEHAALITILCILMVALVITDPTRSLVMSTAWAVGVGYTGLPIIQAIRNRVFPQAGNLAGGEASQINASESSEP
jgi:hypothetical protein